jgi:hypothetical protein
LLGIADIQHRRRQAQMQERRGGNANGGGQVGQPQPKQFSGRGGRGTPRLFMWTLSEKVTDNQARTLTPQLTYHYYYALLLVIIFNFQSVFTIIIIILQKVRELEVLPGTCPKLSYFGFFQPKTSLMIFSLQLRQGVELP